jgi:hypothetical protein
MQVDHGFVSPFAKDKLGAMDASLRRLRVFSQRALTVGKMQLFGTFGDIALPIRAR